MGSIWVPDGLPMYSSYSYEMTYVTHGIVLIFSKNKGLTIRMTWAPSGLHVGQVGLSGMHVRYGLMSGKDMGPIWAA